MFNRRLEVRVARDERRTQPTEPEFTEAVRTVARTISHESMQLGKKVLCGVLLYVAADTARQVLINRAANPNR